MQKRNVFISYSWDSEEHQEWVLYLAKRLRERGLVANVDVFETQQKSVHLYQMMVDKVRDSDFIIIVLTENYAKKADNFQGGVGFESLLTLPLLMENPNKLVPIMRHQGDYNKVFPFHLKGHYAIDFSNDSQYENQLEELIYRLYEKPRFYVEPVGEVPPLEPKIPSRSSKGQTIQQQNTQSVGIDFSDLNLQKHKRITDRDIDKFLKDNFKQIITVFHSLFSYIQSQNPEFDFDQENVDNFKTIFNLYVDGTNVNNIKIWYGGTFRHNTINLSYGRHISMSDNSMNEIITHETDNNKNLKLKMTMNIFGNNDASTPEEIVKHIWKTNIAHSVQ